MAAMKPSERIQEYLDAAKGDEELKAAMEQAYAEFIEDCTYPTGRNGERMHSEYFVLLVAYHMVRCGWRRSAEPVIKSRRVDAPGVYEDAIEWVPMDAPDDPLEGVETMTFAEISALPEYLRRKAIRRLNGNKDTDDDLPPMGEPAWQVTPNISFSDTRASGDELLKGGAE